LLQSWQSGFGRPFTQGHSSEVAPPNPGFAAVGRSRRAEKCARGGLHEQVIV
jgi:hypothetical protein